jgi:hypothetical protein
MHVCTQVVRVLGWAALAGLVACSGEAAGDTGDGAAAGSSSSVAATEASDAGVVYAESHEDSLDYVGASDTTVLTLNKTAITVAGAGATATGAVATITAPGTYLVTGTLDDGQIVVNSVAEGVVQIVLSDATIACSTTAPLYVMESYKTVVILAAGTTNSISDGASYASADEPDAAIFSADDLTFYGEGSLTVNGNYGDAIASKDGLLFAGGEISVNAKDDGARGKDYLIVKNGDLTVVADGDGLKSTNDSTVEKGYILIAGGVVDVTAGADGIQAARKFMQEGGEVSVTAGQDGVNSNYYVAISGGTLDVVSGADGIQGDGSVLISGGEVGVVDGGGSGNAITNDSAKGVKSDYLVQVSGNAVLTVNSADNAVHSNGDVEISGGTLTIASGDNSGGNGNKGKGLHADSLLTISGGTTHITKSFEGLEGADIVISGGYTVSVASDDGLNVYGGGDGSGSMGAMSSGTGTLTISGGYLAIYAEGDGVDVNGSGTMSGGTVVVHGPVSSQNAGVDLDGDLVVTGGLLVSVGLGSMAAEGLPAASSSQNALLLYFGSAVSAGRAINIQNAAGASVLTFVPAKQAASLLFTSPDFVDGTYTIYTGGTVSGGTETDGLYTGASYTPGTAVYSGQSITGVQSLGSGGGGGGGGMMPPGGF